MTRCYEYQGTILSVERSIAYIPFGVTRSHHEEEGCDASTGRGLGHFLRHLRDRTID